MQIVQDYNMPSQYRHVDNTEQYEGSLGSYLRVNRNSELVPDSSNREGKTVYHKYDDFKITEDNYKLKDANHLTKKSKSLIKAYKPNEYIPRRP